MPRAYKPLSRTAGPDSDREAGLDLPSLDRTVDRYFRRGLAPSTTRTYDSAKRRYLQFCSAYSLQPLPTNETVLCRYVAHLAEEGLAPSSIKAYLSAARHLQIAMNLPDPRVGDMARLEQVLKGAKREYTRRNPQKKVRLPLTPDILLKMRAVWSREAARFDNIMMWAACCLCYFGFLRSGEVTIPSEAAYDRGVHLNVNDVVVDDIANPSFVKVTIKASKTDQFRKGVDIFVGRTRNALCPVEALLAYVARRGTEDGLLFRFEDGRLLTKDRFIKGVRDTLTQAGVEAKQYAGHSFRIGAATMAGKKGLPSEKIQTLGRWESSAYLLYIRLSRKELVDVSQLISTD